MGIESGEQAGAGCDHQCSQDWTGRREKVRFEASGSGGGPGELRGSYPLPDAV